MWRTRYRSNRRQKPRIKQVCHKEIGSSILQDKEWPEIAKIRSIEKQA